LIEAAAIALIITEVVLLVATHLRGGIGIRVGSVEVRRPGYSRHSRHRYARSARKLWWKW
jgi:hypothetical protein